MIFATITAITSILGIIGFFAELPILLYIAGIAYIIDIVVELNFGALNNIGSPLLAAVISIIVSCICDYNILNGICFGLCIENLLMYMLGLIFMLLKKY